MVQIFLNFLSITYKIGLSIPYGFIIYPLFGILVTFGLLLILKQKRLLWFYFTTLGLAVLFSFLSGFLLSFISPDTFARQLAVALYFATPLILIFTALISVIFIIIGLFKPNNR